MCLSFELYKNLYLPIYELRWDNNSSVRRIMRLSALTLAVQQGVYELDMKLLADLTTVNRMILAAHFTGIMRTQLGQIVLTILTVSR